MANSGASPNPTADTLEKIVYPVVSQRLYFGAKALACPPLEGRVCQAETIKSEGWPVAELFK